jgi:hypothetical protein
LTKVTRTTPLGPGNNTDHAWTIEELCTPNPLVDNSRRR